MLVSKHQLGQQGPMVPTIGLGCMGMSGAYGPSDRTESISTIYTALDHGINLLDTGDFYGMGHNELLLEEALRGMPREQYLLSVKFGALRSPDGKFLGHDTRPEAVKNFVSYSLQRLNTDYIDIYRPARLDPNVPIEETIGAIADLVKAGSVRYIGLSEVSAETIRRAHAVHPITDLQIEYSLMSRGIEDSILPTCRELGIGITAYGVLSRGLISSGSLGKESFVQGYFRAMSPRFQGENLDHNLGLVEALAKIAKTKDVTVVQIAIAWVMAQGKDIVPLIGARRVVRLQEAMDALKIELSADDLKQIERAVPKNSAAGSRYPELHMKHLDSEKVSH
jgi:aryl-alcohol dehydrogenase-like predicted oxidoreductase